ncbi:MAG: hypothetical protein COC15_04770 [Legionellales bacterium]|nr:MAG: hypothetical protein COC15_04770 [Legionellales bacterium]
MINILYGSGGGNGGLINSNNAGAKILRIVKNTREKRIAVFMDLSARLQRVLLENDYECKKEQGEQNFQLLSLMQTVGNCLSVHAIKPFAYNDITAMLNLLYGKEDMKHINEKISVLASDNNISRVSSKIFAQLFGMQGKLNPQDSDKNYKNQAEGFNVAGLMKFIKDAREYKIYPKNKNVKRMNTSDHYDVVLHGDPKIIEKINDLDSNKKLKIIVSTENHSACIAVNRNSSGVLKFVLYDAWECASLHPLVFVGVDLHKFSKVIDALKVSENTKKAPKYFSAVMSKYLGAGVLDETIKFPKQQAGNCTVYNYLISHAENPIVLLDIFYKMLCVAINKEYVDKMNNCNNIKLKGFLLGKSPKEITSAWSNLKLMQSAVNSSKKELSKIISSKNNKVKSNK